MDGRTTTMTVARPLLKNGQLKIYRKIRKVLLEP